MTQQDISVLGLGHMGATLAHLFLESGFTTTVWNRSVERAAPLVAAGATAAPDPAAAVGDAAVAVICLDRYEHAQALLEQAEVAGTLSGHVIVNLTWGTPDEARTMSRWVGERGGRYLDGNIYDYPTNLGPDSAGLSYAGDRSVFDAHRHLLAALGRPRYDGADPALPNILGSSGGIAHHVAVAGFYEAAAYAAHYGVSPAIFLEFHERLGAPLTSHACQVAVEHLQSGDFTSNQAALRTHFDSMVVNCADMRRIGQPAIMLGAFHDVLANVVEAKGDMALAAVYEDLSRPET
ncbi:putative oxidoreductase [Rhodococcus opacus B4]|uniref:Putative oxidoreductase n=2 Tax=Rhodococcus opacus TaxID=37919 RepID=C1B6F4_RHOOB|nr:NAD(P)-binding domain-containing protein [Rhodococcus opacus]BAH51257.1 putative oxidoreductase [Rhodococcus opacus B4]